MRPIDHRSLSPEMPACSPMASPPYGRRNLNRSHIIFHVNLMNNIDLLRQSKPINLFLILITLISLLMDRHFPSMTSLRAFEAVARHRNVSAAAAELFVTQPAVSQQVRHLEASLGVALTVRLNRGIELTREGEVLAARLTRGFAEIRAGVEIARSVGRRDLSVSVALLATFAQRWLIHRLASFQQSFPDIAIRLIAATSLEDLDQTDADIIIRCGTPRAGGLVAERLIANQFFPVASPALLDARPLATPQDLRNHILIRVEAEPRHMDWPVWFQNAQAANIQPRDWIAMSNFQSCDRGGDRRPRRGDRSYALRERFPRDGTARRSVKAHGRWRRGRLFRRRGKGPRAACRHLPEMASDGSEARPFKWLRRIGLLTEPRHSSQRIGD